MRINDRLCNKAMDNFKKIKSKYNKLALLASVILGVCCGVAFACLFAVVFKTSGVIIHWAVYIPIAIAFAAGFCALFYFILRPTDEKVAKKIDADFALGQKAQTMVEFSAESGAMIELQREQAEEALSEVAKKPADLSWLLKFIFVPVLAAAMLFAGIFAPAKKQAGGPVDPPYDITLAQETALKALIADVEGSDLVSDIKTPAVEALNGLLEGLQQAQQQSVMKKAVISAVAIIDNLIATHNTYLGIYAALNQNEKLAPLAKTVVDGVTYYRTDGSKISTIAAVKAKKKASDEAIDGKTSTWLTSFMQSFTDGGDDQPLPVSSANVISQQYSAALAVALSAEVYAESGDELVLSLKSFANGLGALSTSGVSAQKYYNDVQGTASAFTASCAPALATQSYNCMMDEFIRNSLAKIFNLSLEEFGDNQSVVPTLPDADDPDDVHGGGYGGGDIKYGSDDLVLDVDTGELVTYGQLLDKFNAAVEERIRSGACAEDMAKYIRQYFQYLYRGLENEDGNG